MKLPKPSDLDTLTSLRFFAAASIVFFHMQGSILPLEPQPCFALGVSFFFVLSGFILAYVYQDGVEPKKFYVARFARLWPIHIATLLLTLCLPIPNLAGPERAMPLIANVMLVHGWISNVNYIFSFNAVSWSISAELFFYLFFPFLIGPRIWKVAFGATALVTFGCLAAMELAHIGVGSNPSGGFSPMQFILQHPFMRILEFTVGIVTGRYFVHRQFSIRRNATVLEIGAVAAIAGFAFYSMSVFTVLASAGLPVIGLWLSQSGALFLFAPAIFIFAHQEGLLSRILRWRALVLLGEISFSTYMLHQIVIRYAVAQKWPQEQGVTTTAVAVVAVVYIGSYFLWRFVEIPSRRWIKEFSVRRLFAKATRGVLSRRLDADFMDGVLDPVATDVWTAKKLASIGE